MAEKRDPSSRQQRLVIATGAVGRSGIQRIEVLPENFVDLASELKSEADAKADPMQGLRPEHLFACKTPDGTVELMLLLDTIAGGARRQIHSQWTTAASVELPRPSVLWPSLRKIEAELSDVYGIRWKDDGANTAWPGGPVVEFLPDSARTSPSLPLAGKGGTA